MGVRRGRGKRREEEEEGRIVSTPRWALNIYLRGNKTQTARSSSTPSTWIKSGTGAPRPPVGLASIRFCSGRDGGRHTGLLFWRGRHLFQATGAGRRLRSQDICTEPTRLCLTAPYRLSSGRACPCPARSSHRPSRLKRHARRIRYITAPASLGQRGLVNIQPTEARTLGPYIIKS